MYRGLSGFYQRDRGEKIVKIRNGFVSNSSSSSFILIAKTPVPNSKNYGKTFTRESSRHKTVHNDWEYIDVEDMSGEISYCRGDIMRINSISDKIRYIMALYARWYESDPDYFRKILIFKRKIFDLGISHWYYIHIPTIPLYAHWAWAEDKNIDYNTHKIETSVKVYTECSYSKQIVDLCEDKDTSRLDSFIFNPQSFGILGGDEYVETYKLRKECLPELTYEYEMITDYPNHKKGELAYVDSNGFPVYWEREYDWKEEALRICNKGEVE